MRLTALLSATLLLAPGLTAQEPASLTGLPMHGSQPEEAVTPQAPALSVVERPSDVVARLARQALTSPDDTATWKALAGALPAMALSGDADLEGTFEAARLADSLSLAEVLAGTGPQVPPRLPPTGWWSLVSSFPGQVAGGALIIIVVFMGVAKVRARRRSGARPAHAPRASEPGRLWTARTLATSGASVTEIAKRTGMAQEAVDLVLNMGRTPAAAPALARKASVARSPQSPPSRPAEERLRREVMAGVGRLKDRRLTYGGGTAS